MTFMHMAHKIKADIKSSYSMPGFFVRYLSRGSNPLTAAPTITSANAARSIRDVGLPS